MGRRQSRGLSLGTVLIVSLLVVTLGVALAGSSVLNLRFSQHSSNQSKALNAARSVVAAAAQEVFSESTFGADGTDNIEIRLSTGELGRLAFNETQANDWGILYSTNNLEQSDSKLGSGGQTVPGGAIRLIGVGESDGVSRRVEAIIKENKFPYAVASTVEVTSQGELTIGGLDPSGSWAPEDLLPADLVSNADSGPSVDLGPDTLVTGDVQSPGTIRVQDPAKVKGEVREGAAPVEMPEVDLNQYDPSLTGASFETLNTPDYSGLDLEGAARREGDLRVTGDINLDGSLLFVDGELEVTGGIKGTGIVAVTGGARVERAVNISGANQVALLTGGETFLGGTGQNGSFFQGLVYTRGRFHAQRVTIIGSLVVNAPAGNEVILEETRLLYTPQNVEVEVPPIDTSFYFWMPDFRFEGHIDTESSPPKLIVTNPFEGLPGNNSWSNSALHGWVGPFGELDLPADLAVDQGELRTFLSSMVQLNSPSSPPNEVDSYATNHMTLVNDTLDELETNSGEPQDFVVEPSEFLKPNEANRLRMWREF
jgi:Tfp pilus assembly protein PilX/cytoskeletal protein CcmA (bactofilin family)